MDRKLSQDLDRHITGNYGEDSVTNEEEEPRQMTFEEILTLKPGDRVLFEARDGRILSCKVNGQIRTWKTRPLDLRVPLKYGLYEYSYMLYKDGRHVHGPILLIKEESNG